MSAANKAWTNVTAAAPCPSCGGTSWCSVSADGTTRICNRRKPAGATAFTTKGGAEAYRWRVAEPVAAAPNEDPDPPEESDIPRADAATRTAAYDGLLTLLGRGGDVLDTADRAQLLARGLDEAQIARNQYWTHPDAGTYRDALASVVATDIPVETLIGVPGFARADESSAPTVSGPGGLGIPVRDVEGRIVGARVRVQSGGGKKKYLWLSCPAGQQGATAEALCHVPLHDRALRNGTVRVTEGELKADIATQRSGVLTVSIPGVGMWSRVLPVLKALDARRVLLAFDGDASRNPHVARALQQLAAACVGPGYGYDLAIETWPATWKGIDDALVGEGGGAGVITAVEGPDAWGRLRDIATASGAELHAEVVIRAVLPTLPDRIREEASGAAAFAPEVLRAAVALRERNSPAVPELLEKLRETGLVDTLRWQKKVDLAMVQSRHPHLRVVEIDANEERAADETIAALAESPELYQRDGLLVRVLEDNGPLAGAIREAGAPRIATLPEAALRELCASRTKLVSFAPAKGGTYRMRTEHPPTWLVRGIDARPHWDGIRPLELLVETPVMTQTGEILTRAGYDAGTGILLRPNGDFAPVPSDPTSDEVKAALALLFEAVADMPFASPAHRSAWLAASMTPLVRPAFRGPSPLHLIDANTRGSGKSLLADLIGEIVAGRSMARVAATSDDNEWRKRILAFGLAGTPLILIDNVVGDLGSPALDAALTSTRWSDRLLGKSQSVETSLCATWYATGNNVQLAFDTARRVSHIRLETPEEKPEERGRESFRHPNLLSWARENRGRLVGSLLTLVRAFHVAGRPGQNLPGWGSFDGWSDLVRNCLVWLGEPDPGEARKVLQEESDPTAGALADLIEEFEVMCDRFGGQCTVSQMMHYLEAHPDNRNMHSGLVDAIGELVPTTAGRLPSPKRVGQMLRLQKDRVQNGKAIRRVREGAAGVVWTVRTVSGKGHAEDGEAGCAAVTTPSPQEAREAIVAADPFASSPSLHATAQLPPEPTVIVAPEPVVSPTPTAETAPAAGAAELVEPVPMVELEVVEAAPEAVSMAEAPPAPPGPAVVRIDLTAAAVNDHEDEALVVEEMEVYRVGRQ